MTIAMRKPGRSIRRAAICTLSQRVKLTAEGERFLAHACNIINSSRSAIDALHDRSEILTGTVRIGIAETLSAYLIPDILNDIERRFLCWRSCFYEATAPELVQALREQRSILPALTSNINHDNDLEIETFIRSQRRLWTSIGIRYRAESIRLIDVEKLPFLLLETDIP